MITAAHASSPSTRQASGSDDIVSLSTLSLYPHSSSISHALARIPQGTPKQLVARPMAAFSSPSSDIMYIRQHLDHSTDQQSVHHQQLVEQLVLMVAQQSEMIVQQNEMLREQAEAKEREEKMLAELEAAKKRDEEMHRMQQQTIDRLIVTQQRIETILVQNYELHEYPIPRLFVILPDSYEKWDPRNFLVERFRLYFLCECGDHCKGDTETTTSSGQLTIAAASPLTDPIPVRNSIHLAKHDGYELSRPTEFFDRYGPYVLGMLQVLRHCLAVAAAVAPAVTLAETGVKDIMDGIKSISASTMEAVDMSIDFLQQKLDNETAGDRITVTNAEAQEEENIFNGLAALEGADLRQLDTFLRKTDADKVLGNLYRVTTDTGHVKWVCLDHYRQVYRELAMASFIQVLETNGGTYDSHLGKITIFLNSSTAAKDFFSRLLKQALFARSLNVTLDWAFASADLVMIVDKIGQSNIRDLELNLQDLDQPLSPASQLRPGKGRYHSLLGLLFNTKIKGLTLSNVAYIGHRTSNLSTSHSPSLLQSFHYLSKIYTVDDSRLANIISLCPHLVDLRLGAQALESEGVPKIDMVIGSLSKLEVLHRYNLYPQSLPFKGASRNVPMPYGSIALRELVEFGPFFYGDSYMLERAIEQSLATLEVLLLYLDGITYRNLYLDSMAALSSSVPHAGDHSIPCRLTRLEFSVPLARESLLLMASVLPSLPLVHLGVDERTSSLLAHVNLAPLKSLSVRGLANDDLVHLCRAISLPSQVESLRLGSISTTQGLLAVLEAVPLRQLRLDDMSHFTLLEILPRLNLSQLQVLTLSLSEFTSNIDNILATRRPDLVDGFDLQVVDSSKKEPRLAFSKDSWTWRSSGVKLAYQNIRVISYALYQREYHASILPPSSQ